MCRILPLLLLCACGSVSGTPDPSTLPDGGAPDGPIVENTPDAMPPDAMPEPIRVRVQMNGAPGVGLDVVFHDPTGAVVMATQSDAMGRAELLLPGGGMVTVLGPNRVTHTVMGARPGDTLTFADVGFRRGGDSGQGTLTFPSTNPTGTVNKIIASGCFPSILGAAQASFPVFIGPECGIDPAGNLAVMAIAVDNTGNAVGFTTLATLPFSTPGFTIPAFSTWMAPPTNGVYGITGLPAALDNGKTFPEILAGDQRLVFPEYDHDLSASTSLTSHTFAFAGVGNAFLDRVRLRWPYDNGSNSTPEMWVVARGPVPLSGTLDYATLGLPELAYPAIDVTDPARPRVPTVLPAGGGDVDGGALQIQWLANANQEEGRWSISFPPDQTEVRFPALPEALSDRRPTTLVDVERVQWLFFADVGAGGASAFRALPGPWEPASVVPALSGTWRVTVARYGD